MEQNWQTPQDLLGYLSELKSHGFDTLLQNLREDLQVAPAVPSAGDMRRVGGRAEAKIGPWGLVLPRVEAMEALTLPPPGRPGAWPQKGPPRAGRAQKSFAGPHPLDSAQPPHLHPVCLPHPQPLLPQPRPGPHCQR